MKKIIIVLSLLLVLPLFSFCSENSEKQNELVPSTTMSAKDSLAFVDLSAALKNYNEEFEIQPETKGKFWRKFTAFCACDLFGYIIGSGMPPMGLMLGIMSSISSTFCDFSTKADITNNIVLNSDYNIYPSTLTLNSCDSIGLLHNQIIYDIYNENPDMFNSYSEAQIFNLVLQKVRNYYPSVTNVSYDDCHSHVTTIINLMRGNDIDNSFIKMDSLMLGESNELSIVKSYCQSITTLDDDECLKNYSTGFRQIVLESEIPTSSKQLIQSSISVAGSSELLWADPEE